MFKSLKYNSRDSINVCDIFDLKDSCFGARINTWHGSPKLKDSILSYGNPCVVLAVINYYENSNLNVAKNLAHYYYWLRKEGLVIDDNLIKLQLSAIECEKIFRIKAKTKYYNGTMRYFDELYYDEYF